MGNLKGVSVGSQPLIMEEKMRDENFPTAVLTMLGQIKQKLDETGEACISTSRDSLLNGDCPIIIGHPESWSNNVGQDLLRQLHSKNQVILSFVDELHQGLSNHWNSIRPQMQTVPARMRIFLAAGGPTVAMSATATASEVEAMVKNLGLREKPIVLRASPVQDHIKFELVRRPANYWGLDGDYDKSGNLRPGLLALLDRIYLSKFIENTIKKIPVKKCLMFFREEKQMLGMMPKLR